MALLTVTAMLSLAATTGVVLVTPRVARADTAPASGTPATVSADSLPTVQINGVVWSQVTVGNTVYATGRFTSARPAGSAAGSNETPRANFLAYDITTGNLITSFNHTLDAQGLVVRASPDNKTIYVGGDFTKVDGAFHSHLAAFSTSTGALVTGFNANLNSKVRALAVTAGTVYVGGDFTAASGATRGHLAAVDATTGAALAWAPTADDSNVTAMVMTPDQSKVVVGGSFSTLDGTAAYGMGALDPASGAVLPWAANATVRDAGANAAIDSLRTDGNQIYGTGFVFGPGGNLEGTFAADPGTGAVNWVEDCHGDSYDTAVVGNVLYNISHSHFCGNIGAFPQTNPWGFHRATAFTTTATQTIAHNSIGGYYDWYGTPAPTQLDWYPTIDSGTYTGQNQGAWSATGNAGYLALGGEFPRVNSVAQQGLVRFAITSTAPNKVGPRAAATLTPTVVSQTSGTARVSFQATWDQDNEALTYKVVRDGKTAAPVYTTTVNSRFYTLPAVGFTDTGLAHGSTHSYRVYVTDAFGNSNSGSSASVTVSSTTPGTYVQDVTRDGAVDYWRLGETAGATGYDYAGYDNLAEQAGVGHGAAGAIAGDSDGASTFDGSATGTATSVSQVQGPTTFSLEAWVNTTSTSGGKVIGLGNYATGNSTEYGRQLYMDNSGHLLFGVYAGGTRTVSGSGTYNDGQWHHVVGTESAAGMVLYVDGLRVSTDPNTTSSTLTANYGYWRVGGDNLGGWPAAPSSNQLAGSLDDVAVYPTALSVTQVRQHVADSGRTVNLPPVPTDSYGKAVYADSPDFYWRLDEAGGPQATDTMGNGTSGNYQGGIAYQAPSTVTSSTGTGVGLDGSSGQIVSGTAVNNPTVYSEELWFNTTTTSGGKLIGLGDGTSGLSNNYDRHVWMLNTGQLVFGTYTGQTNTAQSPASYNDGRWHHMVASQGSDGMHLYVDGSQVATNPQTAAQSYSGYWRVGGDRTWFGASSNYFAGTVDEVAVYPTELTAAAVRTHYRSSPAAVDAPPQASFTATCNGLACTFDGTASTDRDGTVASYAWDFGDGTTATGATTSHSYAGGGSRTVTLTVTDDQGATGTTTQTVNTAALPADAYGQAVRADNPALYWRLDDTTAPTADSSPNGVTGNDSGGITYGTPSPVTGAGGTGYTLNGSNGLVVSQQAFNNPTVYSAELWFTTTTTSGGKLIGFGNSSGSGNSSGYDRHVYMLNTGQLVFGTYDGNVNTAQSPASYNDGGWHHLVATQGSDGMHLYVDGAQVASNAVTDAQSFTGYWRLGGDNLGGWPSAPSSSYFAGSVDEVAVYAGELSAGRVAAHYAASSARPDQPPVAAFTSSCAQLTCSFDGTGSTDSDGTVASYAWAFGDGGTATTATASHTYAAAGSYTATLTATDNQGATNSVSHSVTATPPNQPPTAAFTSSCPQLTCSFDGTGSTDSDGTVASYAWAFGDGGTATTATASHTYAAAGSYTATLTVTDNQGATNSVSHAVTATAPANQPPVARFSQVFTNQAYSFDGSGSTDADGSIASYAWAFGDGATSTAVAPTHTYAVAGDYTVTLTVTDNQSATGTASATVSPRPPANAASNPFASDAFGRTTSNGLGTADVGGAWSTAGTAANLSVAGGTASFALPSTGTLISGFLGTPKTTDSDTRVTVTSDKLGTGSGMFAYVTGRRVSFNNEYRARVRLNGKSVGVTLSRLAGSASETVIATETTLPGITYTAGLQLKVRTLVTGTSPTTLKVKVWPASGTEPTAWQVSATDSTAALQAAGAVGLTGYLSTSATNAPVTLKFSSFSAAPSSPPTAAFTAACSGQTCNVDGSTSSDPSGALSSYQWSWADGTVTTGQTSSHQYPSPGTYRITLTVTDSTGRTSVTTRTVTVPA